MKKVKFAVLFILVMITAFALSACGPKVETVTVTFDLRGGAMSEETVQSIPKGSFIDLPIPTRDGYEFSGWFVGEDENVGQVIATTPIFNDVTIWAKWKALIFDVRLESSSGKHYRSEWFIYGEQYDLPTTIDGVKVTGWCYNDESIPFSGIWSIAQDATLVYVTEYDTAGATNNDLFILSYNLSDPTMSGLWKPGFEDAAKALGYNMPNISDARNDDITAIQLLEQTALKPYGAYLLNIVDMTNAATYLNKVKSTGKPVIFWNRLPDPVTTLNTYDKAYYVGIEAAEGGRYQGKMAADYVNATGFSNVDRNGDGKLGVIIVRGEKGHVDAEDRTLYAPMYLERNLEGGNAEATGSVNDTVYTQSGTWNKVEVLAIVDGTDTAGTTWDPVTATTEVERELNSKGDKVDLVLSNDDGMALGIINGENFKEAGIPIWGVDGLEDTLVEIKKANTQFKGTVKNDCGMQAFVCVQIAKNLVDGKTVTDGLTVVASKAEWESNDKAIWYDSATKCFFVHHAVITADNA